MKGKNDSRIRSAAPLTSVPLASLSGLVASLETAGADYIHIDLEDGRLVPGTMNLGLGLLQELRPLTWIPVDVHQMVEEPEMVLPAVIHAGADLISVHIEACHYPRRTLWKIRDSDLVPELAFNPQIPLFDLTYLLPRLDCVNILTTESESPDCPFLLSILKKVRSLAALKSEIGVELILKVDGGIIPRTHTWRWRPGHRF